MKPGDSSVQTEAEKWICKKRSLKKKPFYFSNNTGGSMHFDGYSRDIRTLYEIYVRYGTLSSGHVRKIMQDVLRLYFAKKEFKELKGFKLGYIFVDKDVANQFRKNRYSWKARIFDRFKIEIETVKLPLPLERKVRKWQKKQKR